VPETPKPQTPPAYATRSAAPAAPARQTRTVTRSTTTRAPAAAAPAPAAETTPTVPAAPVAAAPEPSAVTPPAVVAPAETAPAEAVTTTQQTTSRSSIWPWLLGGLALAVAAIAAMMLGRRRRDEPEFVEESYRRQPIAETVAEPVIVSEPIAEPVAAAPVAIPEPVIVGDRQAEPKFPVFGIAAPVAEPEVRQAQAEVAEDELAVHAPEKTDLAGVADGVAPVARRPWLELGMRPVRAGTNKDEAVADIELTVGNSGDTAARDVRISTFMLADAGTEAEMDRLLAEHRDDSAVPPVTIEPGEGTRIDAHLAASKEELGRTFNPVIVAEARYTLPDGRQGRTSAAFKIGCPSETGMRPLAATRPFVTETVEAELFGTPERA
jgi:hypothetical protein